MTISLLKVYIKSGYMDAEKFSGNGRADISRGYAFHVPGSIPRTLEDLGLEGSTLYAVSEAESALGNLSGAGKHLSNPRLLISPYMKREAVLSSKIEGTKASLTDLYRFEASESKPEGDIVEVQNYVNALEYGKNQIESGRKIDQELLKELHEILMEDVAPERGGNINEGSYRTVQNFIGGTKQEDATYVPPPPDKVEGLMRELEQFIQNPPKMSEIINIALIHYQFEAIHPFADGNGRIGRLLIILYLMERGKMDQPLLYLSAYFNKNREQYYQKLLDVSKEGDYNDWAKFFAEGVEQQSRDALERAREIQGLKEEYTERFREQKRPDSFIQIIEFIFETPVFTVKDVEQNTSLSRSTADRVVKEMILEQVLEQVGNRERNKQYRCPELMKILEEEEMKFDEEETRQLSLTE